MGQRHNPQVFTIPKEIAVEFQIIIQKLQIENRTQRLIRKYCENISQIFHEHKSQINENGEYIPVVILMTDEEVERFEAAYETATQSHKDFKNASNSSIYTTLALYTLEEYNEPFLNK